MAVNIALAVFLGSRILPRVGALDWTILASAGTIGALFGTPVAAALIFSQTLSGNSDVPLWDRLFAPLMAAAANVSPPACFTNRIFHSRCPTTGKCRLPIFSVAPSWLPYPLHWGWLRWCLPRLHRLMHEN